MVFLGELVGTGETALIPVVRVGRARRNTPAYAIVGHPDRAYTARVTPPRENRLNRPNLKSDFEKRGRGSTYLPPKLSLSAFPNYSTGGNLKK